MMVDGKMWGTIYTFDKAGDEFPVHVHDDDTNHITLLLYGGVRCKGHPNHEGVQVFAMPGGTVLDWVAGEPHGFNALVSGTTIANLLKVRP